MGKKRANGSGQATSKQTTEAKYFVRIKGCKHVLNDSGKTSCTAEATAEVLIGNKVVPVCNVHKNQGRFLRAIRN